MSLLYKRPEDQTYTVDIRQEDGNINLLFWSDCGKFGTDEMLDEFDLTPLELLTILQEHRDKEWEHEVDPCNFDGGNDLI